MLYTDFPKYRFFSISDNIELSFHMKKHFGLWWIVFTGSRKRYVLKVFYHPNSGELQYTSSLWLFQNYNDSTIAIIHLYYYKVISNTSQYLYYYKVIFSALQIAFTMFDTLFLELWWVHCKSLLRRHLRRWTRCFKSIDQSTVGRYRVGAPWEDVTGQCSILLSFLGASNDTCAC